jgi:hypothetical protein
MSFYPIYLACATFYKEHFSSITMYRLITLFLLACMPMFSIAQTNLQTPKEFLGYELGDLFVRHHEMVSYYKHVAEAVPHFQFIEYGRTNENRPLITMVISSKENMAKINEVRLNNLRRTGLESGAVTDDGTAIVWLSYNVHGNEASSLDASIKTVYDLANVNNTKTQEWLKNTVVIMDPCINPDGRERYVNNYYETTNSTPNPDIDSKEHREPWPNGRANHYLFDLNRDWAWQTQVESQQRMVLYNQWMPHVHVDFHEQGYNNPYYFAPAAEPFHPAISDWQREFQHTIGKNHAMYFDKAGWLYFTKEVFDLFYPSYGDSYPIFNGAIGMTYEQGGHSLAGLAIETEDGDTLTLNDRLTHHYTTGLSTVEITSKNAQRVTEEFKKYFTDKREKYSSYVIKGTNNPDKITRLLKWLDLQKITYGTASSAKSGKGFDYQNNRTGTFQVSSNDIVISTNQPKSKLMTVLFEPKSMLPDSLTYDITAWSIPYVYDLKAYASTELIGQKTYVAPNKNVSPSTDKTPYAYVAKYQSLDDLKYLAAILQKGIKARIAQKAFSIDGGDYEMGSVVITRKNNMHYDGDLNKDLMDLAQAHNRILTPVYTGFMNKGADFGSSNYYQVTAPKIALLGGPQTSSLAFGALWHYFEKEINYPVNVVYTDYFNRIDLDSYDVVVVPNGYYRLFNEAMRKKLSGWVSAGGNLVLIGSALRSFVDKEGFGLKKYATDEDKKKVQKEKKAQKDKEVLNRYDQEERGNITEFINGAIYKTTMDNSHPLGYGYPNHYFTLKNGGAHYAYLADGGNVAVIKNASAHVSGFVGNEMTDEMNETLVFGVEQKGGGNVIYMVDNPLFRDFWENGKLLFGNAVFIVK